MTRLFDLFGHAHDEVEMLILKLFPGLASCSRCIDPKLVLPIRNHVTQMAATLSIGRYSFGAQIAY